MRATVSGMVLEVPIEVGNSVIEANTFNDGTTIATIADMAEMVFEGKVDESEVGKLRQGMELLMTVAAIDQQQFTAKLEHIAPKGVAQDGAIQFEIRAAIELSEGFFLRANYSANADIVLDKRTQVLAIAESLLQFDENQQPFVEVEERAAGLRETARSRSAFRTASTSRCSKGSRPGIRSRIPTAPRPDAPSSAYCRPAPHPSAASSTSARSRSPARAACLFPGARPPSACAAGLFLRWRMATLGRSLWLDPAMLVWNVITRGYLELWLPLGENQAAPYGFLCPAQGGRPARRLSRRAGCSPCPSSAAAAALLLFARLAVRGAGPRRRAFAVWPLALSSTAIYYAGEVKQYSVELLRRGAAPAAGLALRPGRNGAPRAATQLAAGAAGRGLALLQLLPGRRGAPGRARFAARKSADPAARRRLRRGRRHHRRRTTGCFICLQMRPAASR